MINLHTRYLIADRDGDWCSTGSVVFVLNVIIIYASILYPNFKMHLNNVLNNNILQRNSIVNMIATVTVPAFEFKFNLVVFPLPEGKANVSSFKKYITSI